jgi:hypothetical protein
MSVSCQYQSTYLHEPNLKNYSQGTKGGSNRFPGVVAAPFAMVKLEPDVESGNTDAYSGYLPSGTV